MRNKCQDPCPGTCGQNAICQVVNHLPSCTCIPGYNGDPFRYCSVIVEILKEEIKNPCQPSPCGPNSQCKEVNKQAVCSCLPSYIGSPPSCRPECTISSECPLTKACINQKCGDPCPGSCGLNTKCEVRNHSPICICTLGYTGDPFTRCYPTPPPPPAPIITEPIEPCYPSPCGPNSECRSVSQQAVCICLPNYFGQPPNCRPECTVNSDCSSNLACINQKCVDPCPGSCGLGAICTVRTHTPICECPEKYTGDAFTECVPQKIMPVEVDKCNPSPCGRNALCNDGVCTCLPEYHGDPYHYDGCRPECILNSDCPRDKTCIRNKCKDPCPGTCGQNAECAVINHIPTCSCIQGYTGNAFVLCNRIPDEIPKNPCNPTPCGPNSQCREINRQAVCSCVPGFLGTPPACRPECVTSTECSLTQACVNQKCIDPCPGTCGINALCQVVNHNPICRCENRFSGDPFTRCLPIQETVVPTNPCQPTPCGPNSQCKPVGDSPSCSCLPEFIGSPPNCRPECVSNTECSNQLACINQKCKDPCPGTCGLNAECRVVSHTPNCVCLPGYTGDSFSVCSLIVQTLTPVERPTPCLPSPCGANAECIERNGVGACKCLPDYIGDPYGGCRPECSLNSDCPSNKACINNKCKDPCPGACGNNAVCQIVNHLASCSCLTGYSGDPWKYCRIVEEIVVEHVNPCQPSPCGPNSQCREINEQAVCSCLPNYIGSPPGCRPECTVSTECPHDKACINQKCGDPCPGTCGLNANCQVIKHSPICSCQSGHTGDPFTRCYHLPPPPKPDVIIPSNPCVPSPCGPNSQCRDIGGVPSCSCLSEFIGSPPGCRPECTINSECSSNLACINQKCRDPCPGSCGHQAVCNVINHVPTCTCNEGFTGDPFTYCQPKPPVLVIEEDPCNPSPCGPNANCNEGICTCIPEYHGDPYVNCRPECVLNNDCSRDKACIRNKCVDPCPGACGQNAECATINHIPSCTCLQGFEGNAFVLCTPISVKTPKNPCNPSPCGPNSQCREINEQAVCSCVPSFIGSPPNCRPECISSSECALNRACVNQKCIDPCPGTCGINALCQVVNHNPICTCQPGQSGDPFTRCQPIREETIAPVQPCNPSPCGPNSQCREVGDAPSCSCLPEFIGTPPNCRPECVSNSECANHLACINQKCKDPCPGTCGLNAECRVVSHTPNCVCLANYVGNPFIQCQPKIEVIPVEIPTPCIPSPCGINAECRELNGAGSCTCVADYIGNPYEGCRPECTLNSDCPSNKACINSKCKDPCPGTCGLNAECQVINHLPACICISGFTGDAFRYCSVVQTIVEEKPNPCHPSPCGLNSQCREVNGQAVCSCLPEYTGSPPNCRPECTVSSECAHNKACLNRKCVDPCPGTCGLNAKCDVINHSPICSCQSGHTGDPFTRCYHIPPPLPDIQPVINPCEPSPCGLNSQCRDVGGAPSCSCLENYRGVPPNCQPECTIHSDCSSNLACMQLRCRDPCAGACGAGAACNVISHIPVCLCPEGYTGDPFTYCIVKPPEIVPVVQDACNPSPCGPNANCNNGVCTCISEYHGDPYRECRPECVLNTDCNKNLACINNKCKDPCPGTCGQNALCSVYNHIPTCTCNEGFQGNAFVLCSPIPAELPKHPCNPSPCGANSQCREINGQAVCSCVPGFIGSPPTCRPECVSSSECALNQACVNQKCIDPCPGTCGLSALCQVVNHNPICSCPPRYSGDPFARCLPIVEDLTPEQIQNPCIPSPCGPNAQCKEINNSPSCSCLPEFIGTPPNCRPECVSNSECPNNLACINQKCKDPCPGICGENAECRVVSHTPNCVCIQGYVGNPFVRCDTPQTTKVEIVHPCFPSPCGANAVCKELNNAGSCTCLPDYIGNPYEGCRPECVLNSDCPRDKSCVNRKCVDPCPGTCGQNAECTIFNHYPSCTCLQGFSGDPFVICSKIEKPPPSNPCYPSPCGPNSQCRDIYGQAVCSCLQGYFGAPPTCRPECVSSSECPLNRACVNQKCVDPCPGTCGINALCQVVSHNAICTCPERYSGDPFIRCQLVIVSERPSPTKVVPENPCVPSPCGLYAQCEPTALGTAKCICLPTYIGNPPNCRPECQTNSECAKNLACINQKCKDPCPGSCGLNARCLVANHVPNCICQEGFRGDPFTICHQPPPTPTPKPSPEDPCRPSPCGANAICHVESNYGVCECLPEYRGNPYEGCRPECLSNGDCPMNRACIRSKCVDPCPGTCGIGAECFTTNHVPVCTCPDRYTGDAFRLCTPVTVEPPRDPCNPSPCGINTICRKSGENAICECLPGFFGTPTAGGCRPECTISADCDRNRACVNNKCIDPCPGVCGYAAICNVINHSPVCSCPPPLIGDPFLLCREPPEEKTRDPCNPSPCNINGQCQVENGVATCIYPECIINQDCPRDKACYSQKCRDPCRGACGINALCQVVNHQAVCSCPSGYVGSAEVQCLIPDEPKPKVECTQDSECTNDKACINSRCLNPCTPGLCGQNADCRPQLHRAVCTCRDGYTGNAQQTCFEIGCRSDSECAPTHSCVNKECVDPCLFTSCGLNAQCRADYNHKARCYCPNNFRGDPFVRCERPECTRDEECPYNLGCRNERCYDPCNCGLGAICSVTNHRPQCSCPPGYTGNPLSSCKIESIEEKPECKMDADCPKKLACFNGICKNPCYETHPCGKNTECIVVDSLPLRTMSCMCLPGYVGDADTECRLEPQQQPGCKSSSECQSTETCINRQCINPCAVGSPCAVNAECAPVDRKASCKCPPGLIGDPFIKCYPQPQTRPECKADSECSNDKSCINQRCQNPCELANPCGSNAECKTSFHRPTCSCPRGWLGNPQINCYKPECTSNQDCPYDKACINEYCQNPCNSLSCGRGAECIVQKHFPQCQCPLGTQGNPLVSCITGICHYNEDCADHEACDRLNRVCRPVCDEDTCADGATCIGQQHQPKCNCPPGTTGNPFVKCLGMLPEPEGCRTDSECPSQFACINAKCVNPCTTENVCTIDQECIIEDTLPLRTILCQCPPETMVDAAGRCVRITQIKPQCVIDSECNDKEKCISGTCIEACRIDRCGVNAICTSRNHQAICSCAPGYTGNAHYECTNVPKGVIEVIPPECYTDRECVLDKVCRNERCVNPCTYDSPCAPTAFCSVRNHQAICKCPNGYDGNPAIDCIAPLGPTVGCTSNSECPKSESCINRLCTSPCNCGPNADCKVVNHYPTCYCRQGYSGNAQIGCVKLGCQSDNECASDLQCYNGQCINPCILGNPCPRNAECYGHNHRSTCRCLTGFEGNALSRCERVECHVDNDCPNNRACLQQRCVDPCSSIANPPCAQNAVCYVQNHVAGCLCPPHLPDGNPLSYCSPRRIEGKSECDFDIDCPSKLACIKNECVNPCVSLSPCHPSAQCSVSDTTPVRTMICTCPEGWVPNENGECHPVIVPIPPGCTSDGDCSDKEACINRLCTSPCECGTNANCHIQNHRAICSCREGYEGNPNIACHAVGCRVDSECGSGRACINGNCLNPCLIKDNCGINAECFVYQNRAECRCASGYRGNPLDRCTPIGCLSNSDCPSDRQCINAQCINPCIYDNPCSPRAECSVHNHLSVCRCPPGLIGNPYVSCKPEPQPECKEDSECPSRLACLNNKCQDPCAVLEPCRRPAECQVIGTVPVRTMICICPPGYISSGSGTCNPVTAVTVVGACISDSDCPATKACYNGICKNPCTCGPNAECRIKDHKPICTCKQGYDGNPELECRRIGCRADSECSTQHTCINRQCVPVCAADGTSCGDKAVCYGYNHRAVCECPPGLKGNPRVSCNVVGCRIDSDCPSNRACINTKCELPCTVANPCDAVAECKVYNHVIECICPPGTVSDGRMGCIRREEKCRMDWDCPSQYACIGSECVNPCNATEPCGVNAECSVLDTRPVRTMVCICVHGYQGNPAVQCDPIARCPIDKGYFLTPDGRCICAPNLALNENDECIPCPIEKGLKIDERGRCVCALEKGLIIDERGNCVCPLEFGYHFDAKGNCVPDTGPECEYNDDCPDHKYCNQNTKTCEDACLLKHCGINAFCNATNHQGRCICIAGYVGNAEILCNQTTYYKTDFPRPDLTVNCLSDGVQVEITLSEIGFNGILYVKGHSKDEKCRRVVSIDTGERIEYFKVHFGECGLIHVNGEASFVLVIQKHPKLVTYKAQAYHIKCVYHTGEQNVTLGFNVSMLTTAGTIANTGPPPTCLMKIVTPTGEEINSAEIGDNLMLQVDVQPGSIYGGFARSCVAKTMEDSVENEYIVTDENGCATDPTIFGEWEYNPDTQSLLASFNAFKFPSSDNIRFQCNIRVCFGKCQPVNCRGYNAFGRRKRAIEDSDDDENGTDLALGGDLLAGQLREEITIQSNAILTLEKREERYPDSQTAANAQRAEDICVSMIGFIIALIITALLALVAVAVAVSCWLMAYRRRPKSTGPLPHPPEFPNPLFTTPEPMAEPSPDYLT
ncbi:unnamed protein product [Psylliodes chrysocephalus]|uniref:Uncharacterized protein n=1 Tax=Psylliodes chrysocephalus TaxID=3402493 RepID=A0A9P0CJP5_9CUCU|nr:unnamed protein product [Psylliodes chrysocephala]